MLLKSCVLMLGVFLLGGIMLNTINATSAELEAVAGPHFDGEKFHNTTPIEQPGLKKMLEISKRYFTEKSVDKAPTKAIPVAAVTSDELAALSNNDIHVIKLGHSSVLLKVFGEFWLLDPVFSERASPFRFAGPKRFHQPPIALKDLPAIDKVLISHNHYDHLDKACIKKLASKTAQFLVPLGVEADLEKWGVAPEKIVRFDWWQEYQTHQGVIAFTPTQHFSGRGMSDGNTTLWGSWVIKQQGKSVYFSGDSGYFDGFAEIGKRYGPFDLALIETGAYDRDWADVHMTPEQSVQASLDLQANTMIPVHNGTFDLAFHAWYEPLERVVQAAQQHDVNLLTPAFGEKMALAQLSNGLAAKQYWWRPLMPAGAVERFAGSEQLVAD